MATVKPMPGAIIEVDRATIRLREDGEFEVENYDGCGEVWMELSTVDDDCIVVPLRLNLIGHIEDEEARAIAPGQCVEISFDGTD